MNIRNRKQRVASRELRVRRTARSAFKNSNRETRKSPLPSRRGILLLVVLSMLTLFLMLGTAYLVSANYYRKAAKLNARAAEASYLKVDQASLLEQVINQLVRDTNNQHSALRFHSLLRDLYGNDGLTARIDQTSWAGGSPDPTAGQMVQFVISESQVRNVLGIQQDLSPIDNAYNGLVLTFLDGSARGQSTRIVGYHRVGMVAPYLGEFRVVAFPLANGQPLSTVAALNTELDGSRILINGRPFNGTGAGYNRKAAASGARLNADEMVNGTARPIALLPSTSYLNSIDMNPEFLFTEQEMVDLDFTNLAPAEQEEAMRVRLAALGPAGLGGSDESYDAVDFQNMALALMPVNPAEIADPTSNALLDGITGNPLVLPSFHRPALINYWSSPLGQAIDFADPINASMLRKVLLRPNWFDNPGFTGSNPEYAAGTDTDKLNQMIYGPWDVDNDNDGVRDSVWVDFGAPVMAGPNGTLVKPLAALLVVDLGGRLNVNAHGTIEHLVAVNLPIPSRDVAGEQAPGVSNESKFLPQGQGYGPADISLRPFFSNNILRNLLLGANTGTSGRYGLDVANDRKKSRPGDHLEFDFKAQVKMQGVPRWANRASTDLSNYVTPPDFHGRYRLGLNALGQPVYEAQFDGVPLEQDSPYELDLSLGGSRGENPSTTDTPYSLAELERVLRAYDVDAGTLPSRIWDFANNGATTPDIDEVNKWRALLTTDSYDLPVPNGAVPKWMIEDGVDSATAGDEYAQVMGKPATNATFAELLEYRYRVGKAILNPSTPLTLVQRREFAMLLPQDLADGLRMDINRPIGNGLDDDNNGVNNGVVDEPGEVESSYWEIRLANGASDTSIKPIDPRAAFTGSEMHDSADRDGDGFIDTVPTNLVLRDNQRRQDIARDLYVLAMTLVDPLPATASPKDRKARPRQLAQWAINAVDFRDPDNCMTPFEYDENPFDGWGVDGDISTTETDNGDRGLVWGAERPELLITETLAWHDRNTVNTREQTASTKEADSGQKAQVPSGRYDPKSDPYDLSQDQRSLPRGAAFIELYNPWPVNPAANEDTHLVDASGNDLGVDLASAVGGSPVWRLMVYKDGGPNKDPDSSDVQHRPDNDLIRPSIATSVADRSVYFTGVDPNLPGDGVAFYNSATNVVPSVRPGRYLVIGAGEPQGGGEYLAKFGEDINSASQRGIRLRAGAGVTDAVAVLDSEGRIVRDADGFEVAAPDDDGSVVDRVPGAEDYECMSSVAIIDETAAGTRRFTLSEPAQGYPSLGGVIRDVPFDDERAMPNGLLLSDGVTRDEEARLKLPVDNRGDRTIPAFSWIYLQRLANPLLPFDKDTNPYLTVDSMGANVTVFNGVGEALGGTITFRGERRVVVADGDPPKRYGNTPARDSFCSLQRGRGNDATRPYEDFTAMQTDLQQGRRRIPLITPDPNITVPPFVSNLWATERVELATYWRNDGGADGNGMENGGSTDHYFEAIPDCTLGFMNEPFRRSVIDPLSDRILPTDSTEQAAPFPWFNWNNRPYVSASELIQVPACCSSQLLHTFSYSGPGSPQKEQYGTNAVAAKNDTANLLESLRIDGATTQPSLVVDGRYGHLLNFFRTTEGAAGKEGIVGLHRVLEYLHVPSPFVGSEMWLNPTNFGGDLAGASTDDPRYQRQPPFNRISTYREPGRVNLNTVADSDVYFGLMHGDPASGSNDVHSGPSWDNLRDSRRGYPGGGTLELNNDIPTFFANPFRSADAGDLVPLDATNGSADMTRESANCTLLREGPSANEPLFSAGSNLKPYSDFNRNSYFRYQPMTRLDNLTTTRSNVFAVWVTVGIFEVEAGPDRDQFAGDNGLEPESPEANALYDRVYPDGYMLAREAGLDTGDVRRVREFAIIDRSIPVAFEPGADHNVERAIRLRRRID